VYARAGAASGRRRDFSESGLLEISPNPMRASSALGARKLRHVKGASGLSAYKEALIGAHTRGLLSDTVA
jgi:hypothetical protein